MSYPTDPTVIHVVSGSLCLFAIFNNLIIKFLKKHKNAELGVLNFRKSLSMESEMFVF